MIIALTGFMGCGKTTVGKTLASRLGWPFIDLDLYIEKREGALVREIFSDKGEEVFRAIERDAVREVIDLNKDGNLILSLGGGTILNEDSRELILKSTCCVYLKAGASTIRENLSPAGIAKRPLLAGNGIDELLEKRAPVYGKAQITVETDGLTPMEIAEIIVHSIK